MVQSSKFVDSFYYEHKGDLLDKINHKRINSLTDFYDEVIYGTHISSIDELETLINISKAFNDKIKILILGPIPNIDNTIDPLKCFIKSIECSFKTSNDIDNRKLKKYYLAIDKILIQKNNFLFYNPYKIICPKDNCNVYSPKTDILTHRESTHLTMEGSLLLREDFLNFYQINFER